MTSKEYAPWRPPQNSWYVLSAVHAERLAQDKKWGQQNHPDGTSEYARYVADAVKVGNDQKAKDGRLTWLDILHEEFCEANAETDPEKLRAELVQVAAVAVAWIECIDRRKS